MSSTFYAVLANTLVAAVTNYSVWFAVTFWAYLQTKSVVVTSVMAGLYLTIVAGSGFLQGAIVDRFRKKNCLFFSSIMSLVFYGLAAGVCFSTPAKVFADPGNPFLWLVIAFSLLGAVVGNIRTIALSTLVTLLIPDRERDRANGLVGTVTGIAFLGASAISGVVIGYFGMFSMLAAAMFVTALAIFHLAFIHIKETKVAHGEGHSEHGTKRVDIAGTMRAVRAVPGLGSLILFTTFNNFLSGVFMSLLDAYGLSLVSVQTWGFMWAALSLGMILGGLVVARKGLGKKPLKTMIWADAAAWFACCVFTLQSSIVLLFAGCLVFMCLMPCVEAAEQTILQRVIPYERQGRVFGFAQSVEQAASPLTAFAIGPIAQFIFIPYMTTGNGVQLIGSWFGSGPERGLALVFTISGIIGFVTSLLALKSSAYKRLSQYHSKESKARAKSAAGI